MIKGQTGRRKIDISKYSTTGSDDEDNEDNVFEAKHQSMTLAWMIKNLKKSDRWNLTPICTILGIIKGIKQHVLHLNKEQDTKEEVNKDK